MDVFNQQFTQLLQNPVILTLFIIWLLFWKGWSLWQSANRKQLIWFIILLMINTMGILEIAYIVYLNRWDIDNGKILAYLEKKFMKTKK